MDELYSLLIPLAQARLIVPRVCVAEVVGFVAERQRGEDVPPWLLGTMSWSDRKIAVVSFERACGQELPPAAGRTRVVVLRCLGDVLRTGFYGIATQGFPQLVRVSAAVLEPDPASKWPESAPVICQLRMINQRPIIPDLERLERMIAGQLAAAA